MAGKDFYTTGNELFVDDKFDDAYKSYTHAIEAEPSNDQYYMCRAQVLTKLCRYHDAVVDATKAVELNPHNSKAFLRKGIAEYHLKNFVMAKSDLETGKTLNPVDVNFDLWLEKSAAELAKLSSTEQSPSSQPLTSGEPAAANIKPAMEDKVHQQSDTPVRPQIRHDWYQTETHVVVSIMLKNIKKEDFNYDIQPQSLSCRFRQPDQEEVRIDFQLQHTVVPEQSQVKLLSSKVEVKLKKSEGIHWQKLATDTAPPAASCPSGDAKVNKYPTSSHSRHDWDRLVAEIKEEEKDEKLEGDAALNKLFQQIYSDGSDEVRRAMNKSFMESGGTVLSTNWNEIGSKPVECKPPDGMEFKKWEQ